MTFLFLFFLEIPNCVSSDQLLRRGKIWSFTMRAAAGVLRRVGKEGARRESAWPLMAQNSRNAGRCLQPVRFQSFKPNWDKVRDAPCGATSSNGCANMLVRHNVSFVVRRCIRCWRPAGIHAMLFNYAPTKTI